MLIYFVILRSLRTLGARWWWFALTVSHWSCYNCMKIFQATVCLSFCHLLWYYICNYAIVFCSYETPWSWVMTILYAALYTMCNMATASQWHEVYCHDLEVVSSNPSQVEFGVHSTSVPSRNWTKQKITITVLSYTKRLWHDLTGWARIYPRSCIYMYYGTIYP